MKSSWCTGRERASGPARVRREAWTQVIGSPNTGTRCWLLHIPSPTPWIHFSTLIFSVWFLPCLYSLWGSCVILLQDPLLLLNTYHPMYCVEEFPSKWILKWKRKQWASGGSQGGTCSTSYSMVRIAMMGAPWDLSILSSLQKSAEHDCSFRLKMRKVVSWYILFTQHLQCWPKEGEIPLGFSHFW